MNINTGVKAGGHGLNGNEKLESEDKPKSLNNLKAKLRLNKETIKELRNSDLKKVGGGRRVADTQYTDCEQETCV